MLAVAGIAAYVSYWHAYAVVLAHGETGITARLEPATVDGLVYASSMVVLSSTAPGAGPLPRPLAARAGNRSHPHGEHGTGLVTRPRRGSRGGWPAVSLVGSYELLIWLVRTSRTLEREPSAEHRREDAACDAAEHSAPVAVVDSEQQSRSDRNSSIKGRRSESQSARQPATVASAHHDHMIPESTADNDAAVAAYRLSVKAGNPLSERKLAQMFGHTSRRWARARIADARQSPLATTPVISTAQPCGRSAVSVAVGLAGGLVACQV